MTKAALQGSLVDIRNVGTHKSVKLTIHVPEELALNVTELFGWPTAASPVPVALARLVEITQQVTVMKQSKRFHELPIAQQAAMRCNEGAFRQYLADLMDTNKHGLSHPVYDTADQAAVALRGYFNVASRKDIKPHAWERLDSEYQLWCRTSQQWQAQQ